MKFLKNNIGRQLAVGFAGLILISSSACRKEMDGLNQNLKGVSPQDLQVDAAEARIYLPGFIQNIISPTDYIYQLQQNLGQDAYAGYMAIPSVFVGNENNLTYAMVNDWVNNMWDVPANNILNKVLEFKKKGYNTKYPDFYGIALICRVFAASRAVDAFGPIPYSKYGDAAVVPFDSEETVYNTFFSDLDSAVANLTKVEKADPDVDQIVFKSSDRSGYAGDYAKWIALANSLRLRLAIRISNVSPDKARTEGEKAINNEYGFINTSFQVSHTGPHPIFTIATAWTDVVIAAPIETYLGGYNDPRLPAYALPATSSTLGKTYKGVRVGIELTAKGAYVPFSIPNITTSQPIKIMDAAEIPFLEAEAALRGWTVKGGTAQSFYEAGVTKSFSEYTLGGVTDYLADATSVPTNYVDPINHANDGPALSNITIKWNSADSYERQLERIITQKWIALYPEGCEAWAEFRRTGYPKLYPVVVNKSNGAVPPGGFIRRVPYTTTFTNASGPQTQEAINKYLGGSNSIYKALWWAKQ